MSLTVALLPDVGALALDRLVPEAPVGKEEDADCHELETDP